MILYEAFIVPGLAQFDLPGWAQSGDISTGSAREAFSDLASGGRVDMFGDQDLPIDPISITHTAQIDDYEMYESLRNFVGKKVQLIRRIQYNDRREWVWARLTQVGGAYTHPNNRCGIQTDVTFEPYKAAWRDIEGIEWYLDETPPRYLDSGLFLDGGIEEFVITTNPQTITLDTTGTGVRIKNIRFNIIPITGQCSNIRLDNLTNNQWFQWNGTITSQLVVDTERPEITLNGTNVYNSLTFSKATTRWMELEKGENQIRVSLNTTGSALLQVKWEKTYL